MKVFFTKKFRNSEYEILFNEINGFEITRGINGKQDPFSLELPSLLDIGIMGSCKNHCKFCYQGDYSEPDMKLDDFKSIIDQTKHHVNQVALGGRGDPNKHKHFKEIVEYCRKNKVVPNYTTSGVNLTDEEIEISRMCGAVGVSDYGMDFTYSAISRLTNKGIKVSIHIIYTRDNHDKIIKILKGDDVWNGKVNNNYSVLFLLFKPQGRGKNLDWLPTSAQIQQFSKLIFRPNTDFMVGIDSCLVNKVLTFEQPNRIQKISIDTCESSRCSGYITPDMKMMPCSFADKDKFSVDINNDIYSIWNSSNVFKKFRKTLRIDPKKCPLF